MPSRNNTTVREEDEVDFSQQDPVNVIYTVGIYGWRKRCVYFIILLTMVLAIINLALTIWILTVMDFSWDGMGKLRITDEGLILDGHAEFVKTLSAYNVRSRKDTPLHLQSDNSVTVNARDVDGMVTGQIFVGNDSVIAKNEKFIIRDLQGKEIFYADTNGVTFGRNKDRPCTVKAEFDDKRSFETKLVRSPPFYDLKLESPTRSLFMEAPQAMDFAAKAGSIKMKSLNDISLQSLAGKITLDAKDITFKDIKTSSPTAGVVPTTGNVLDVCLCPDGSIFLAPVVKDEPCRVTGQICS